MYCINKNYGDKETKTYVSKTGRTKTHYHAKFEPVLRKKQFNIKLPSLAKRVIALILICGFIGLHTFDRPQPPAEAQVPQDEQPPSWAIERYPDKEIKEHDSTEENVDLFVKYFGEVSAMMRAICSAESGLNPEAIGDTNTKYPSVGICQIRLLPERQLTKEQMFNPEENIKYAKLLYDKYGFTPWTAYKNGSYKKFL